MSIPPVIIPTVELNDGKRLPAIGLGTGNLKGEAGIDSMVGALGLGYRLLDTALNYENESEVGEAVRRSFVDRSDIVVTTKVPGRHHGFTETLASFEESRANLGLDFVDLYLIHWPLPRVDRYVETWKAMIQLREEGKVGSIGVCNFLPEHLDRLRAETGVTPAVNQIEVHPHFPQGAAIEFNAKHGIVTESWSPLKARNVFLDDTTIVDIADRHGVTATQVVLRWHVEIGAVPIPKSAHLQRQRENIEIFGFSLSTDEISAISALETGRLGDGDPATHEEF